MRSASASRRRRRRLPIHRLDVADEPNSAHWEHEQAPRQVQARPLRQVPVHVVVLVHVLADKHHDPLEPIDHCEKDVRRHGRPDVGGAAPILVRLPGLRYVIQHVEPEREHLRAVAGHARNPQPRRAEEAVGEQIFEEHWQGAPRVDQAGRQAVAVPRHKLLLDGAVFNQEGVGVDGALEYGGVRVDVVRRAGLALVGVAELVMGTVVGRPPQRAALGGEAPQAVEEARRERPARERLVGAVPVHGDAHARSLEDDPHYQGGQARHRRREQRHEEEQGEVGGREHGGVEPALVADSPSGALPQDHAEHDAREVRRGPNVPREPQEVPRQDVLRPTEQQRVPDLRDVHATAPIPGSQLQRRTFTAERLTLVFPQP